MDYKKVYDQLVEKAKPRGLDKTKHEGYFEIHHIVPRCMGGGDEEENLVMLTGREHYIAHILLWKMYPKNSKLFYAAWMMANFSFVNSNSRIYQKLKEEHVKTLEERSGFNNPNYRDLTGEKCGRLTVVKQVGWSEGKKGASLWLCVCECGTEVVHRAGLLSGGEYSPKSCGCYKSDMLKSATGEKNPFYGKLHSPESRKKMSEAAKKRGPNRAGHRESLETRLSKYERNKPRGEKDFQNTIHPPWSRGKVKSDPVSHQAWYMADFYLELWKGLYCPGEAGFVKDLIELDYGDNKPTLFRHMIKHFREGWNPREDPSWLEFREEYERS